MRMGLIQIKFVYTYIYIYLEDYQNINIQKYFYVTGLMNKYCIWLDNINARQVVFFFMKKNKKNKKSKSILFWLCLRRIFEAMSEANANQLSLNKAAHLLGVTEINNFDYKSLNSIRKLSKTLGCNEYDLMKSFNNSM